MGGHSLLSEGQKVDHWSRGRVAVMQFPPLLRSMGRMMWQKRIWRRKRQWKKNQGCPLSACEGGFDLSENDNRAIFSTRGRKQWKEFKEVADALCTRIVTSINLEVEGPCDERGLYFLDWVWVK